ncbi:MAG: inorganic phosphate transporter [Bacteroidales bacterium]|nr:inorganic phosphate transporter [Bacteroidales bacterium]
MEAYYILIIGVLFLLAVSDLIVGVSNDAVNFLNSAIGSKAAPFKIILAIAAAGVLVGAVFSNGMMEVARKGIFNPEFFAFNEIMIIFLAVMLTDILLLDFFNTIGLPTSTTVSIVFEILGAAVAVSIYKVTRSVDGLLNVSDYINVESSVMIIVGIFLSVIIAFIVGMIIQWIVRLAFSFNVKKTHKYWTGVWGGFAITAILFFLLIKGAKGSTLISADMLATIKEHTTRVMLISFLGWTLLFQLLTLFTRINVLKITVLMGTFALAMAFAGNDLVNFIGVPLAGFESFKAFMASGSSEPAGFLMTALREPVNTPIYFLIAAGLIMVLTLRFSKKAKSVTATTIDLSRQDEGSERFASSSLARFLVRRAVETSNGMTKIMPSAVTRFVQDRFDAENNRDEKDQKVAFDLVRASVNLVVASILIAIGTSLKLPLSTTYVTFMVAMGTSLADGAWGRESAVFRITGVLTVIGGWFFTAFSAFLASFLIASLIFFGKLPVILILIVFSIFILLRTHAFHKRRTEKQERLDSQIITASYGVLKACDDEVKSTILKVSKILYLTYTNLFKEKHKELKNLRKETKRLSKEIKEIIENIPVTLRKFDEHELESGHHYVQVVAYMKEMSNSLMHIVQPAYNHLNNNHPLDKVQADSLKNFNEKSSEFFNFLINILKNRNFDSIDELVQRRDEMINMANDILLNRIKILKKTQKGVKISVTYMEMLSETKNLFLNAVKLVKADALLQESLGKSGIDIELDILD